MKAIIVGITGQDGSYLAEFLLSRGYEVHGTVRPTSTERLERIDHIIHRVHLHHADLLDQLSLIHLIEQVNPDEIYNLAALSYPSPGWQQPIMISEVNGLGPVRLLEAIRLINPAIRFFQASSTEMFGRPTESPQTEQTPFLPVLPVGTAKLYAHRMVANYREKYGLKASCGILFDHESPRRGLEFVTRRITHGAASIKLGLQEKLVLDTLDICSDWGFAGDFVRAFWMILQHPLPDDFIIATGQNRSLEDFCRTAFAAADLDWRNYVEVKDPFPSGTEAHPRKGDITRAKTKLLWEPEVSFEGMISMMVEADIARHSLKNRLHSEPIAQEHWQGSIS